MTKNLSDALPTIYDCIILPGMINPFPTLFDDQEISFLQQATHNQTIIAAISSAPILLAKAGLLTNRKFIAGLFMQMVDHFSFVDKENFIHQPIVEDQNAITAIGIAYKEFAQAILHKLGLKQAIH